VYVATVDLPPNVLLSATRELMTSLVGGEGSSDTADSTGEAAWISSTKLSPSPSNHFKDKQKLDSECFHSSYETRVQKWRSTRETKEAACAQFKQQQEEREAAHCTFSPSINSDHPSSSRFFQRTQKLMEMHKAERAKILQKFTLLQEDQEAAQCTFKPVISEHPAPSRFLKQTKELLKTHKAEKTKIRQQYQDRSCGR
jgi:hypothetical protein